MKAHLTYLWYVLRHKWFVFVECCQLGILWLGVVHDLSRFRPSEWFAYIASQPYNKGNKPLKITRAFEHAWNHHQHRNKHHWEYWVHFDYHDHNKRLLPMPDCYRREILADWRGASQAKGFGRNGVVGWYQVNKDKMQLHPKTRQWLEAQLELAP